MARDRQRAKRRRRRTGGPGGAGGGGREAARPADGAGTAPAPDPKDRVADPDKLQELDGAGAPGAHDDDDTLAAPAPLRHASADVDEAEEAVHGHAPTGDLKPAEQAPADDEDVEGHGAAPPTRRGGSRVIGFLRACWAELRRVQWPDRRHTAQATAVVLGFVVVAGAFLGASDFVFSRLVDWILGL